MLLRLLESLSAPASACTGAARLARLPFDGRGDQHIEPGLERVRGAVSRYEPWTLRRRQTVGSELS